MNYYHSVLSLSIIQINNKLLFWSLFTPPVKLNVHSSLLPLSTVLSPEALVCVAQSGAEHDSSSRASVRAVYTVSTVPPLHL